MMRLFGGFPQSFWNHYCGKYPIPGPVDEAIPYYQLYYLLVHVHFFGQSYCRSVEKVLEEYGM
jgi:phosphatidylserine decarboxylase